MITDMVGVTRAMVFLFIGDGILRTDGFTILTITTRIITHIPHIITTLTITIRIIIIPIIPIRRITGGERPIIRHIVMDTEAMIMIGMRRVHNLGITERTAVTECAPQIGMFGLHKMTGTAVLL